MRAPRANGYVECWVRAVHRALGLKRQTRPPADIVGEDQQGSVHRRDLLGCLLLESSELQEGPCAPVTPRTTDIATPTQSTRRRFKPSVRSVVGGRARRT